jgi:hypothetical protein
MQILSERLHLERAANREDNRSGRRAWTVDPHCERLFHN